MLEAHLQRPPEPEQQALGEAQFTSAPLEQKEQQGLLRGWIEQGLHPLEVAAYLLQATDQQPLPQAHGLTLVLGLRSSLKANITPTLQQGFNGVLQALGINVLKQAGGRQLQQLFPRQT